MKKATLLQTQLLKAIKEELENNHHTRRLNLQISIDGNVLRVYGMASTYFQKQMVCTVITGLCRGAFFELENQVVVR